jgi:hypothetical protein
MDPLSLGVRREIPARLPPRLAVTHRRSALPDLGPLLVMAGVVRRTGWAWTASSMRS